MQGSREQQRKIRKPSYVNDAKKQGETIQWERLEISSRKLEISREYFIQDGHDKYRNDKDLTEAEEIKKWQEYTELY